MRQRDYIYRRAGSANWWLRLGIPKDLQEKFGKEARQSLGTCDRQEAEIRALPLIHQHKLAMMTASKLLSHEAKIGQTLRYQPGEHWTPDGDRVIATPDTLVFLDRNGVFVHTDANSKMVQIIMTPNREERIALRRTAPRKAKTFDPDEAHIRLWIEHKSVKPRLQDDAWATWRKFRELCPKPLSKCTRDDGRALARHYLGTGLRSATVRKKVGFLRSAVNLAIDEGKLSFNPFSNVTPQINDGLDREPMEEEDMAVVRARLLDMKPEDHLLWLFLSTTGMRLSEPFQINREYIEHGIRYVIVGSKTDASERRVPLPDALLPYLPARIENTLFSDSPRNAGRRLLRWVRRYGIRDKSKVLHSLRHRAKDRLRAAECPLDVQYQLLGHEEQTVAADYGRGYPVTVLKKWVEHIGS